MEADKAGDSGVLKPPPDADTAGCTENSPLSSNRISLPTEKIENKAIVGVDVRGE